MHIVLPEIRGHLVLCSSGGGDAGLDEPLDAESTVQQPIRADVADEYIAVLGSADVDTTLSRVCA